MNNLTITEFTAMCEKADWYYRWEDRLSDMRKGEMEITALRHLAKQRGPEYIAVFNKFVDEAAAKMPGQDNGRIE